MSSAGIIGAGVGGKLIVGACVTGACVLVVGETEGDSVGAVGLFVGVSVGFAVGLPEGLSVMSVSRDQYQCSYHGSRLFNNLPIIVSGARGKLG